jgi:general stress protein 26
MQPAAQMIPANTEHGGPEPWPEVRRRLAAGQWYWLATVGADGRPHVVPVLAVALDDALYFVAADASRKARNLARSAQCALSVAVDDAHLVVHGRAARVLDETILQRAAATNASKYAWHPRVRDGVFDADYGAPTAGPPPYALYELTPDKVLAFGVDEAFSPTRFVF